MFYPTKMPKVYMMVCYSKFAGRVGLVCQVLLLFSRQSQHPRWLYLGLEARVCIQAGFAIASG